MTPKAEKHYEICDKLNHTYQAKNHDYGDSFAQLRKRLPNAILVRLYDKYLRLETLLNGATQQVTDESINDTLLDMANYCIMEVIEREGVTEPLTNATIPPSECSSLSTKWDEMSNDGLWDAICIKNTDCRKCPLFVPSGGWANTLYNCNEFKNFRKVAIAWLKEQERDT